MKRSAAILGPTPSFVRWAIRVECPLRDLPDENLPDSTFRELRGLRELSYGLRQNRVFNGICIHPEWNQDSDTAKGFFTDEICEVFGGQDFVDSCCKTCPANACQVAAGPSSATADQRPLWAGCYGWFPSRHGAQDYLQLFHVAWEASNGKPDIDGGLKTTPCWYGLWQVRHWTGQRLEHLNLLINQVIELGGVTVANDPNLGELAAAVRQCRDSQLSLETELVPAGHSDGIHWCLESHCPDCSKEMDSQQLDCPACGRHGRPHPESKRKVLGQRPYRPLKQMIGPKKTEEIILTYKKTKNPQVNN